MKTFLKAAIIITAIVLVGCQESATHVTVNKDGSGTIVVREFFSPQMLGMMGNLENMAEDMVDAMADEEQAEKTEKSEDEFSFFDSMIEKQAEKMGPGVKLVKKEKKENEQGWEGFEATFAFKDINKVRLDIGKSEMEDETTSLKSKGGVSYTFKFKPGDPASLNIIPVEKEPEEAASEEKSSEKEEAEVDDEMMMEMMSSMLKGFRMIFTVSVNGDIKETNSNYRSESQANTITVVDMPFDKMMGDEKTRKILFASKDPGEAMAKLKEAGITDVHLEEPDKTISIKF